MGTQPTAEQRRGRMAASAIEGAKATEDYRAAERAATERMAGLREARMQRDAAVAQDKSTHEKIAAAAGKGARKTQVK